MNEFFIILTVTNSKLGVRSFHEIFNICLSINQSTGKYILIKCSALIWEEFESFYFTID